jgi:hypothetical protein
MAKPASGFAIFLCLNNLPAEWLRDLDNQEASHGQSRIALEGIPAQEGKAVF